MMSDPELDLLKAALDSQLAGVDPKYGVAFGVDAFRGFNRRGWFTMETFTVSGTGAFPIQLPAYDKTRFAFCDLNLPDNAAELPPEA